MLNTEKIFVNSAWTKSIPAKSPQGTDLEPGVNAFTSIAAALEAHPDLGEQQVILLDKDAKVSNTSGDTDINFAYLASQEIDKDGSLKGDTATSKVTASGNLSLTYNADAGADEVNVEGFANVKISTTVAEPESTPYVTVLGGKSTVSHSSSGDEEKYKESATISSNANGDLTVSNSKVALAGGIYAEVDDEVSINTDVEAFKAAGVGSPYEESFAEGESALDYLAGYTNVTLKGGSFAGQLIGGSVNYSTSRQITNVDDEQDFKKTFSANTKGAGTLTVSDSELGAASGYATAEISGESNFSNIFNYTETVSEKSNYTWKETEKFDTDLETMKSDLTKSVTMASAGKATITNLGEKDEDARDVTGYSTVTVSKSDVGNLTAGGYTMKTTSSSSADDKKANADADVIRTSKSSSSTNRTYSQSGTLDVQNGSTGMIDGFSKVTLNKVTSVDGSIVASSFSYYNTINAAGFAGKSQATSSSTSEVDLDTDEELSYQASESASESAAAGGTLTISTGSVDGGIAGFATVTAAQVTVEGGIAAGKFSYSSNGSESGKLADESENTKYSYTLSSSAAGTLNVSKDSVINSNITGFATVTLDDTEVNGYIYGGNTTDSYNSNHSESNKNGYVESNSSKYSTKWNGTGKLEAEDGSVAGTIRGYATVTTDEVEISGGLINVGSYTYNSSHDDSEDTAKSKEQSKNTMSLSMVSGGTATLKETTVGITEVDVQGLNAEGSVIGFATVTAEKTSFAGSIIGGKKDSSSTETYSAAPNKDDDIVETSTLVTKSSESATGKFTMTKGGFTDEEVKISGFQTVSLTTVAGEISNGITAGISNDTKDSKTTVIDDDMIAKTYKKTNTESATGSLTISAGTTKDIPELTVGMVKGFSKVSADYGTIAGIDDGAAHKEDYSLTFSKTEKKDATISSVKATITESNTAAGSVTLSGEDTLVEGNILGYSSVTVNGAKVGGYLNGNTDSKNTTVTAEADEDGYLSSNYTYTYKKNPSMTLNLSNQAEIQGEGYTTGVKTAVINRATAGNTYSFAINYKESSTLKFVKDGEYSGTHDESWTETASGTYTLTSAVIGTIEGAAKVTATDSQLGTLDSRALNETSKYQMVGPEYSTTEIEFPEFDLEYAKFSTDPIDNTATKFTAKITETYSAKATATLEKSIVEGSIIGFGSVKLTKSDVAGNISAYAGKLETSINYDKKKLTETITETGDLTGSLTASKSAVLGNISGYNTVTLEKATVLGAVTGGKTVTTTTLTGEGDTYGDAYENAWEDPDDPETTITAAGTLKTSGLTTIVGQVASFKSATFNGDATVLGGIYGITGEKDTVTIAAKSGLTLQGTAVLGMKAEDAANTIDTVNISGVLRIAVADAEDFTFSVNKFTGKGAIAIQQDAFEDVRDALRPYVGSQFEFINGGDEYAVTAVRSSKEELADNQQSKATAMKVEDETHGWLSSQDDKNAGLFADTEDWYSFAKAKAGSPYEVSILLDDAERVEDLQASLWSGKQVIYGGLEEIDGGYLITEDVLSQYSSVQLKLSVGEEIDPLSYRVAVASIA